MAKSRGDAVVGVGVELYLYARKQGTLTDLYAVRQVEVLDTNGTTVLATIAAGSITHSATGTYKASPSGTILDAVGVYFDKWYFTRESGDTEETLTLDFYVSEATSGIGRLTGAELRGEVASNLGRSDLSARIDDWIKLAIVDVYHATRFEGLKSTATFTTVKNVDSYSIAAVVDDSGYGIHKVVRVHLDADAESRPLEMRGKSWLDTYYPDPEHNTGTPECAGVWGGKLWLRPMPEKAYVIDLDTTVKPPNIGAGETFVLDGLDLALVCKATALGWASLEESALAGEWEGRYERALARAKQGDEQPSRRRFGAFGGRDREVPEQGRVRF